MQCPDLRLELADVFRLHHSIGSPRREPLEEDHEEQADYLIAAYPFLKSPNEVAIFLTQNLALPNRPRLTIGEVLPLAIHCWTIMKSLSSQRPSPRMTLKLRERATTR